MTLGSFFEDYFKIGIAILFFKLGILPRMYHPRIKAILASKVFFKKFKKLNLIYNDKGYFKVDPMPTIIELNDFNEIIHSKTYSKNGEVKEGDSGDVIRFIAKYTY